MFDCDGDRVEGTIYEPELQAMNVDPSTEYRIEKNIKEACAKQTKRSRCALVTLAQEVR